MKRIWRHLCEDRFFKIIIFITLYYDFLIKVSGKRLNFYTQYFFKNADRQQAYFHKRNFIPNSVIKRLYIFPDQKLLMIIFSNSS